MASIDISRWRTEDDEVDDKMNLPAKTVLDLGQTVVRCYRHHESIAFAFTITRL